jgi:hypothetical protein
MKGKGIGTVRVYLQQNRKGENRGYKMLFIMNREIESYREDL